MVSKKEGVKLGAIVFILVGLVAFIVGFLVQSKEDRDNEAAGIIWFNMTGKPGTMLLP
jgi:hypothetical protein